VAVARTRYVKSGGADVAYQVLGEGPLDLLLLSGLIIPIECTDEEPSLARFQRRLASFGRLIRFDHRGIGLSDRASSSAPAGVDERVQDAIAVLDALGSERAAVLAPDHAGAVGISLAAAHADRVASVTLINSAARLMCAPDYPWGVTPDAINSLWPVVDADAVEQGVDIVTMAAPSVAYEPAFRAWWDRAGNLGASPAMARALLELAFTIDVRALLRQIRVPSLIIHREDIILPWFEVGHGRYLAAQIAGAKYIELPGADVFYWVGDTRKLLDELEEFITGVRGGSGAERVLVTLLFTDIVGSTDWAARLGDIGWRDLLDRHDQRVRTQIGRFRGHEVNTVGDGFVATFDSPSRAIECALAIRDSLKGLGIDVRAGIHTGEVEVRGEDVAGIAVHIGARVSGCAGPGEIVVSSAVPPLLVGAGVEFTDRGAHELKGVPGGWHIFAVDSGNTPR
jgi:class 3 adenylate cyclase